MAPPNGHPVRAQNRIITVDDGVTRVPRSEKPPQKKKSLLWLYALIFAIVMAVVVAIVLIHRGNAQSNLKAATQQMAVPTVLVVHAEKGSSKVALVLPGTVQAYMQSTVYAQVTGYLKRWLVDIGTPVKEGELLAEIETPALDQQLRAAQATQGQNQASVDLAQVTSDRYNKLLALNAVSQQDVDQYKGNLAVAQANLSASKDNVAALERTEAFKQVVAPFDGVLTARQVDVGDLVNAGTGSASQALFQIAQTTTLRIFVQVPESYSEEMVFGLPAKIDLASNPGAPVMGTLVRTSKSIDPASLTLLSEVDIDNHDGKLFPGSYAQVHFDLTLPDPPVVLPGNTLIFRSQGTQVGVVDSDNIVHLKDIKIGRDFGTKIEVVGGVSADDNVILNPSDSITEGQKVQIKTEDNSKTDGSAPAAKSS